MIKFIINSLIACTLIIQVSTLCAEQEIRPQSDRNLSTPEIELVEHATRELKKIYAPDKHFVVAALKTKSGKIYSGFNLKTIATRASVCAESIALAKATESFDKDLDLMIVVACLDNMGQETTIVSPCGICRELLYDYAPDIKLIISVDGIPTKVPLKELLILPYKR